MTTTSTEAQEHAIVKAACAWRGALAGRDVAPGNTADAIVAERQARLVAAIDAYLADDDPDTEADW